MTSEKQKEGQPSRFWGFRVTGALRRRVRGKFIPRRADPTPQRHRREPLGDTLPYALAHLYKDKRGEPLSPRIRTVVNRQRFTNPKLRAKQYWQKRHVDDSFTEIRASTGCSRRFSDDTRSLYQLAQKRGLTERVKTETIVAACHIIHAKKRGKTIDINDFMKRHGVTKNSLSRHVTKLRRMVNSN